MRKTFFIHYLLAGLLALFSPSGHLMAQEVAVKSKFTIEGTVIDNTNNEPIIGATVRLKNGLKGTTTNNDGKFVLKECSNTDELQVSYIGYKPKTFVVGKKRQFTIYLEENATELN